MCPLALLLPLPTSGSRLAAGALNRHRKGCGVLQPPVPSPLGTLTCDRVFQLAMIRTLPQKGNMPSSCLQTQPLRALWDEGHMHNGESIQRSTGIPVRLGEGWRGKVTPKV